MLIYDSSQKWTYYLNRPFGIFGCSLWHRWYKEYTKRLGGLKISDCLFVEEKPDLVRKYRIKSQMDEFDKAIEKLVVEQSGFCENLLYKGIEKNKEAHLCIQKKLKFGSLRDAINFLTDVAVYCITFPHFVLLTLENLGINKGKLWELSEQIRSVSYYPQLLKQIIMPLSAEFLHLSESDVNLLTYTEVLEGDTENLPSRKAAREEGKNFVYQVLGGAESIEWISNSYTLVEQLEGQKIDKHQKTFRGQIAYKGISRGIARVVTSLDGKDVDFYQGDILVTLNSNPNLMHLLKKSSAIVSDMGGVSCHAAIIARELQVPCVMGTRDASKIIKNGDLIEVDANHGIVRIL